MPTANPENMRIWNKLEVTDSAYAKKFDKGNFKGTAVDATYNIKRVTEQLGPVGFAWGWHVVDQQLVEFSDGAASTWVHAAVVRAWFRQEDGSTREVEHIGQTIAARWVGREPNRRFMVDDDYAKKSVTDALSKIMVSLGASADIWLGRFDGNKYVPPAGNGHEEDDSPDERPPRAPNGGGRLAWSATATRRRHEGAKMAEELGQLEAGVGQAVEDFTRAEGGFDDPKHPLRVEAGRRLSDLMCMTEERLLDTRRWVKGRWPELGQIDKALRENLANGIVARAAILGVDLKETA